MSYFTISYSCSDQHVTPVLKVSRILNTLVKTDTGYINHTIQKTTQVGIQIHESYITLFKHVQSNETSTTSLITIHIATIT